jgi:hypothetical protein
MALSASTVAFALANGGISIDFALDPVLSQHAHCYSKRSSFPRIVVVAISNKHQIRFRAFTVSRSGEEKHTNAI